MAAEHIIKSYDEELERLNNMIVEMGGLAESQLAAATEAVIERDSDRAIHVVEGDAQQGLLAIGRRIDRKSLAFEIVAQHRDERHLVFDDQDERLHRAPAWPGGRSGATTSRLDLSPFGRACSSGMPCTR